jgi:hypothetical protein
MSKLINLGWIFSVIIFLISLLFVYAYLPDQVNINKNDLATTIISREYFFYIGLGIFVFTNSVCASFSRLISRTPSNSNIAKGIFYNQESFKKNLQIWFNSFAVVLNLFLILTILFFGAFNTADSIQTNRINLLVYPSIGLIAFWLVYLLFIIVKRKFKQN